MKSFFIKLLFIVTILNCGVCFGSKSSTILKENAKRSDLYVTNTGVEQVDYLIEEYKQETFKPKKIEAIFSLEEFSDYLTFKRARYATGYDKAIRFHPSLESAKTQLLKSASPFFKYASVCRITKYLEELCKIEYTIEEKETIQFLELISVKKTSEYNTSLERKLARLYNESLYLQEKKNTLRAGAISPIYFSSEDLNFFISFYTLQKMINLFNEEEFDPILFQHVETYGKVIKKDLAKCHNFLMMEKFSKGTIQANSDLEKLARKIVKPYIMKHNQLSASL